MAQTSMTGSGNYAMSTGSKMKSEIIPENYDLARLQNFTPEQWQLFNQLFAHVGPSSYLSKLAGGDEATFRQIEAPQKQQFSQLLGGLGSKFSGMGMGARRSSGFANEGSAAAQNFAMQLGANRQQLQRQALMDMMGISESLLGQRPYEKAIVEHGLDFNQQLALSVLPALIGGTAKMMGSGGGG